MTLFSWLVSLPGRGIIDLVDAPTIRFDRLGVSSVPTSSLRLNGGSGNDSFSVSHVPNWQIAAITVSGGTDTVGDSFAVLTTNLADDVQYESSSSVDAQLEVTAGQSTTSYVLQGIEAASIDALDPTFEPGDVLTSTAMVTPGSEPGSGAVTQSGALPLAYQHFETVNAPEGDTLVIEGTDLGDTVLVTLEDLDNDSQIDEEVVWLNGVPFDVSSFQEVILELREGADLVTVIPHVGGRSLDIPRGLKINGGGSDDTVEVVGSGVRDAFTLSATGTRLSIESQNNSLTSVIDAENIEQVDINLSRIIPADSTSMRGGDTFLISDLAQTGVRVVNLGLGVNDLGEVDVVVIHGRSVADNVTISGGNFVSLAGLSYDVNVRAAEAGADQLQFLAGDGADTLQVNDLSSNFAVGDVTIDGGSGSDKISGYGTLLGGEQGDVLTGDGSGQTISGGGGDDQLLGGGGDDRLFGGPGQDTFIGGGGNDQVDGGAGIDKILIDGTSGNDSIEVLQTSDAQLQYVVNGDPQTDHLLVAGSVEEVRVDAADGADTIRAMIADGLFDDPGLSLLLTIVGGPESGAGDSLTVVDDGVGDLTLYRKSESSVDGTVSVGPLNPEPFEHTFSGIERFQLVDANGASLNTGPGDAARATTFKHDPFEPNNDRFTATPIAANVTIDPTIEAVSTDPFPATGDEDWYRIEANVTGTLDVHVAFEEIGQLDTTRPGLPGNGNLDIELYDIDGTLIAGNGIFGDNDGPNELDVDGDAFAEDERIRIPAVGGQSYFLRVFGHSVDAINSYGITVANVAPPVPFDLKLQDTPIGSNSSNDTGQAQPDHVTGDDTPSILLQLDDGLFRFDVAGNDETPPFDQVISIPFQTTAQAGFRIAIFDDGSLSSHPGTEPQTPVGFATATATDGQYAYTFPAAVSEGSHFISARVEMIDPATPQQSGFGPRSESLMVLIDTLAPNVSFGDSAASDDGLDPNGSDTGVVGVAASFQDRITSDTTPGFVGQAEADATVRVYVDRDGNGSVDPDDLLIGTSTATTSGTNLNPLGQWQLTSTVDLNDPQTFSIDGVRRLLVTAEDLAGNVAAPDALTIFIDSQGPQISDVDINARGNPFNLFNPAPSDGPTPPVYSLVLSVKDLAARSDVDANFLYPAFDVGLVENPGHYSLIGDNSDMIAIASIDFAPDMGTNDQPATGAITLAFAQPLPDDRYTLIVSDAVQDPAGNALDGESNATEPQGAPQFPSGDGIPGTSFTARFTVDSRPEIGTATAGAVQIDANGNGVFDPANQDATNRDFIYQIGTDTDEYFSGNFNIADDVMDSSGFDKIGVYGQTEETQPDQTNPQFRFLLDLDHDGAADLVSVPSAAFQGPSMPVAGEFSAGHSGDEIGLLTISDRVDGNQRIYEVRWGLDTTGNNQLDGNDTIIILDQSTYPEIPELIAARQVFPIVPTLPPSKVDLASIFLPIVGDFNGDGVDDLAIYDTLNNQWNFDVDRDGRRDDVVVFGLPGETERPVAGDWNLDGIDDFGLFSAIPATQSPPMPVQPADFRLLISDQPGAVPSTIFHAFASAPIGNDMSFEFGDKTEKPVFGNFDPPVATNVPEGDGPDIVSYQNVTNKHDVNSDGFVTPADALRVINAVNLHGSGRLSDLIPSDSQYSPPRAFLDVNGDGFVTPGDVLGIVNRLNGAGSVGEGESTIFQQVGSWSSGAPERTVSHVDEPENSHRRLPDLIDLPSATDVDDAIADIAADQCERRGKGDQGESGDRSDELKELEEAIDEILGNWIS